MKYLSIILLVLVCSAFVSAQTTTAKPTPTPSVTTKTEESDTLTTEEAELLGKYLLLEQQAALCGYSSERSECKTAVSDLSVVMSKVAKSPRLLRILAAEAVNRYNKMRIQVRSAPQASQIADEQNAELMRVIVMQNQRIIELLEQLVKKK